MTKFKKICEIQGYEENDICSVIKTLENQGFTVVDDNEDKDSWKTYHVLREVYKQIKAKFYPRNERRIYKW